VRAEFENIFKSNFPKTNSYLTFLSMSYEPKHIQRAISARTTSRKRMVERWGATTHNGESCAYHPQDTGPEVWSHTGKLIFQVCASSQLSPAILT